MGRIWRSLKLGMKSLLLHKLRSGLTVLGIVFGVAAVISMLAVGEGSGAEYLPLCRDAVQSVDRQVAVFGVQTLDDRLAEMLARPRFYTTAVLFFGGRYLLKKRNERKKGRSRA